MKEFKSQAVDKVKELKQKAENANRDGVKIHYEDYLIQHLSELYSAIEKMKSQIANKI